MDFTSILQAAKKNQQCRKEPVKCLQTKFKPPTKAQRDKEKTLSEGVQRFLARKAQEEELKRKEAAKKREELAALRSLDPKANKRIQTMLKRTKSANKSVMDDAVDANNTADTLAGPSQPDEDDYGFVSETSSALYNKLIAKMYNTPSDDLPKFAPSKKPSSGNLLGTKERVKMALLKQEEEERAPHKRKRRKKEGGKEEEDTLEEEFKPLHEEKKTSKEPARMKKPAPPPIDFMELLKLAEKKQHEPVIIEPKVKVTEPDQLMTKKQKEEHRKMMEEQRQRQIRLKALEKGETPPKNNIGKAEMKRIPKIGQSSAEQRKEDKPRIENGSNSLSSHKLNNKVEQTKSAPMEKRPACKPKLSPGSGERVSKSAVESETERLRRERDEALRIVREKEEAVKMLEEKERLIRERDEALAKLKLLEQKETQSKNKVKSSIGTSKSDDRQPSRPTISNGKKPLVVKEFPPKDVRRVDVSHGVRENPPKDVKKPVTNQGVREFPPRDVRGLGTKDKGRPMTKEELIRKRMAELKKRRIEDSDEYDSELDDFIDDGQDATMANEEVSDVISKIFNYDRNKYSRYDDATDECMESNWAQISKEEHYSTKCGILEDLADIQAEKDAKKRKKLKGKKG